jgi:hypothetical protein
VLDEAVTADGLVLFRWPSKRTPGIGIYDRAYVSSHFSSMPTIWRNPGPRSQLSHRQIVFDLLASYVQLSRAGASRLKTLLLCSLLAAVPAAYADSQVFTGSSGNLAASATFNFSGNTLAITLSNTATISPTTTAEALTGVFFDLVGNPTLTPVSALLTAGSSVIQTSSCGVQACSGITNVGGEFSYAPGGLGSLAGDDRGISSSGYLNTNTSAGNFNGLNYDGPSNGSLDGADFGIVNSGFVPFSGNSGMDGDALIKDKVVFTLTGVSGLTASSVSNVFFTYGTSQPGEPSFAGTSQGFLNPIPEPSSFLLFGTLAALLGQRLKKPRVG